jgi:hypothetical protein
MSEHQFEHVEAALEHAGVRPRPPQMRRRRSSRTFPVTRS